MATFYTCTNTSPCSCLGSCLPCTTTCDPVSEECCISACNELVKCEDSVGPCGAVGTFDLTTLDNDDSGCAENTMVFRLNGYDENIFAAVTISPAGIITFTTKGPETAGNFGKVHYKAVCKTREDCAKCGELASNGFVDIGVRDLCLAHACTEAQSCDACTGNCVDIDVNIAAEVETSSTNVQAQTE